MRHREGDIGGSGFGMRTYLRLERRRAYSSRTSCSRGVQVGGCWVVGGEGSAIVLVQEVNEARRQIQ